VEGGEKNNSAAEKPDSHNPSQVSKVSITMKWNCHIYSNINMQWEENGILLCDPSSQNSSSSLVIRKISNKFQ
jgi:hypothetical protein